MLVYLFKCGGNSILLLCEHSPATRSSRAWLGSARFSSASKIQQVPEELITLSPTPTITGYGKQSLLCSFFVLPFSFSMLFLSLPPLIFNLFVSNGWNVSKFFQWFKVWEGDILSCAYVGCYCLKVKSLGCLSAESVKAVDPLCEAQSLRALNPL